jgi:hypothetical protein
MRNRVAILVVSFFGFASVIYSQNIFVEKLGVIPEIFELPGIAGGPGSPGAFTVYEVLNQIEIENGNEESMTIYQYSNRQLSGILRKEYVDTFLVNNIKLEKWKFGWGGSVTIRNDDDGRYIINTWTTKQESPGISFILKKGDGYIAFFVNEKGIPGAADTTGRVYTPSDAMAFLKAHDPEKWNESRDRARHLGLEEKFLSNQVLVWGQTYYSTPWILYGLWNKHLFPRTGGQIQYDSQGNGYMESLNIKSGHIWIVDPNANHLIQLDLTEFSSILSTYEKSRVISIST